MKELQLIVPGGKSKEQLTQLFDQEVEQFSRWMERLADPLARGALMTPEKVLVKTYLIQKYLGSIDEVV